MNSLNLNNKERNKIITKTTSLALASLLITSMFVGLIPVVVMPAAAANTYLSVSQTTIGTNNVVMVTITDASLTNHPNVVLTFGTTNTTILTNRMLKTSLGSWILPISNITSSQVVANAPSVVNGTWSNAWIMRPSLIDVAATPDAGVTTATLTYQDRSETITFTIGETSASGQVADRAQAPPSGVVQLTFSDATENLDSTAIQTKDYTIAVTINTVTPGTTVTNIHMVETGVNTGMFRGALNMSILATPSTSHGDLLSVVFTEDDTGASLTAINVQVRANDGTIAVSGTLTHNTNVNVTLTDADRNTNTLSVQTLTAADPLFVVKVNATITTVTTVTTIAYVKADLGLTETGINTGVFLGSIAVSNAATASIVSGNNSATLVLGVPVGSTLSVALVYTDPTSITANHYSEGSASLSQVTATITLDQTAYLPNTNGIPVIITLTEPDANDNPLAIELLSSANATNFGLNVNSGALTVGKLNITETSSGVTRTLVISDDNSFIETGVNTGVFELRIDLETETNATLLSGESITIRYYDSFNKVWVTLSANIGGALATIAIDRTTLPLSPATSISVKVTVTDADANSNIAAVNTATVTIRAKNATSQAVNFNGTVSNIALTVTETGQNTGIFTGTFTYNVLSATGAITVIPGTGAKTQYLVNVGSGNVTGSQMIQGKFNVSYVEPLATGGHIDAVGTISPSTATLSVTPSGVNINGTVTFTLTDADLNSNILTAQTVLINIRNATLTQTTGTLLLTETGVNTGIFTATNRAGATGSLTSPSFKAGDLITASYTDTVSATSYYATGFSTVALSGTSQIGSNTAVLTLNAVSYGPYSVVNITVLDLDLILDSVTSPKISLIKTSAEECRTTAISNPVKKSDGSFVWTLTLSPTVAIGTCGSGIRTALVDTITVYFIDAKNAAGTAGVILSKSASIASVTGSVVATPSGVLVGDFLTITVTDLDQNKVSATIESVNVVVSTDTWSIGQNVTLPETTASSGIFEAKVKIVSGIPATTNEVRGTVGDTITVSYKDRSNSTGLVSNVVTTGIVGVSLPPLERVPAGTPATVDASGNAVSTLTTGSVSVIQTPVTNDDSVTHIFTYIVQIKDANGVVVSINWIQGLSLASGSSTTPGISWTPDSAGQYTVEVFVWESLSNAVALSPVSTLTVTVV